MQSGPGRLTGPFVQLECGGDRARDVLGVTLVEKPPKIATPIDLQNSVKIYKAGWL